MKRVLAGVLAAALCGLSLLMPAAAGTEPELEKLMADFRGKYGLTEENFSVSYYNTVSGESYAWNDERFMTAASTFKLPLNLYYYELEQAGKVGADTVIDGLPLSECHSQSLVWSNNDVSLAMTIGWGALGVEWGEPIFIVFVREGRFTRKLLDESMLTTTRPQPRVTLTNW